MSLRCPICLDQIPRDRWHWVCSAGCARKTSGTPIDRVANAVLHPTEQSLDCAEENCVETRVSVRALDCDVDLAHPLALPVDHVQQNLLFSLAGDESGLGQAVAALLTALRRCSEYSDRVVIPADPSSHWVGLAADQPSISLPMKPGNRPIGVSLRALDRSTWARYVFLHAAKLSRNRNLDPHSARCERFAAMDLQRQLGAADIAILVIDAQRLLAREDYFNERQINSVVRVGGSIRGDLPSLWVLVVDADAVFRLVSGHGLRPSALEGIDPGEPERLSEVYAHRLLDGLPELRGVLSLPWKQIHFRLVEQRNPELALRSWCQCVAEGVDGG